jgi:hypothetical protein
MSSQGEIPVNREVGEQANYANSEAWMLGVPLEIHCKDISYSTDGRSVFCNGYLAIQKECEADCFRHSLRYITFKLKALNDRLQDCKWQQKCGVIFRDHLEVAALLEVFQEGALDCRVETLSRLKLTSLRIRGKD